jgi:hypothetical protein
MAWRVTTKDESPVFVIPACFWLESSLLEVLDPGQKHAGVTD